LNWAFSLNCWIKYLASIWSQGISVFLFPAIVSFLLTFSIITTCLFFPTTFFLFYVTIKRSVHHRWEWVEKLTSENALFFFFLLNLYLTRWKPIEIKTSFSRVTWPRKAAAHFMVDNYIHKHIFTRVYSFDCQICPFVTKVTLQSDIKKEKKGQMLSKLKLLRILHLHRNAVVNKCRYASFFSMFIYGGAVVFIKCEQTKKKM